MRLPGATRLRVEMAPPVAVPVLVMHADDATARGLSDGDLVRVFNDLAEVHCTLKVAPTIRPGTISLPKGLWRRSTRNGLTGTALVAVGFRLAAERR